MLQHRIAVKTLAMTKQTSGQLISVSKKKFLNTSFNIQPIPLIFVTVTGYNMHTYDDNLLDYNLRKTYVNEEFRERQISAISAVKHDEVKMQNCTSP